MNAQAAPDMTPSIAKGALEQLTHLAARVCMLWGQGEFETYVNRIIMDSRDGARQGLPWEVAQELMFLAELSMAKRALQASEVTGVPFQQMFQQCLDNAEKIGQAFSPLTLAPSPAAVGHWSDPRSNKDLGRRAGK